MKEGCLRCSRVAVFVDAGYLFAQGTVALCGSKQRRENATLHSASIVEALKHHAEQTSGCPLLRIYWYDGARKATGLTQDHSELAFTANVKLRLGFVNSSGQQKGVDSLIVTDLIELARNSAICDAVLLAGDEDLRIGVQIAQGFGVRVHLLGIEPQRGSQSDHLLQEADTTSEWKSEVISQFLKVHNPPEISEIEASELVGDKQILQAVVIQVSSELTNEQAAKLVEGWQASPTIPADIDSRLLGKAGGALDRTLDNPEKSSLRRMFREHIKSAVQSIVE